MEGFQAYIKTDIPIDSSFKKSYDDINYEVLIFIIILDSSAINRIDRVRKIHH